MRDKRQDPWREANDPRHPAVYSLSQMPTLRKWRRMHSSQKHLEPGPVNARLQGVQSTGLRSLTRQAGGDPAGRFRCGTETECNRSSRPAQRRETDSQRHSTGEAGRQMSVFGERERGELPSPIFSTGSGLAGRTNPRSNSKNWPAGICRRAFSRTDPGMSGGAFPHCCPIPAPPPRETGRERGISGAEASRGHRFVGIPLAEGTSMSQ